MMSESYNPDEENGGLDPDNWLVSPQFELGGSLSFWMRSAVADYPDNFAVYLSTTGNSVDDFTIELQPETSAEGASDRGNLVLFREHKLKQSSLGQDTCQVTNQLPPSTVSKLRGGDGI